MVKIWGKDGPLNEKECRQYLAYLYFLQKTEDTLWIDWANQGIVVQAMLDVYNAKYGPSIINTTEQTFINYYTPLLLVHPMNSKLGAVLA